MTPIDTLVGPLAALIDRIVPDPPARDAAKLALLDDDHAPELDRIRDRLAALAGTDRPADPWTDRARPTFLYVMYALLLWSVPMGLVAAIRPRMAHDIAVGMTAYLAALPEPLYALFGTGYVGYTVARTWGKTKGVR